MWSLGCLIPEIVSNGRRDPIFESEQAVLEYTKKDDLDPPQLEAKDNHNLDATDIRDVNRITTCLLDREPTNRFSAKELLHELIQLMKTSKGKMGCQR